MSEELDESNYSGSENGENGEDQGENRSSTERELQQMLDAFRNGSGGADMTERMQSLLARLEHGIGHRNMRESNRPQIDTFVIGLAAEADENTQLASLSGLCEVLSLVTEETLPSGAIDSLVSPLSRLIEHPFNENIVLLATRALTHLMEASPDAASNAVDEGVISPLMARILSVEYIDIAEVALKALESIARIQPSDVLREGFMSASLTIVGFLSVDFQRVIASSVASCLADIPEECEDMVLESIGSLSELLKYEDSRILENACLSFYRLTSHFQAREDILMRILTPFSQNDLLRIISNPQGIEPSTWVRAVTALDRGASSSASVALGLLDNGIIDVIGNIISGGSGSLGATVTTASASDRLRLSIGSTGSGGVRSPFRGGKGVLVRNTHQLREILTLLNNILPLVSSDKLKHCPDLTTRGLYSSRRSNNEEETLRTRLLERPLILRATCSAILPFLVDIFSTTANPQISELSVGLILKVIGLCSTDVLVEELRDIPLSAFLAGCLNFDVYNWAVVSRALHVVQDLLGRLPDVFMECFEREGVFRAVKAIRDEEEVLSKKKKSISTGKNGKSKEQSLPDDVFAMLLGVDSTPIPVVSEEDKKEIEKTKAWSRKLADGLLKEQSGKFGKRGKGGVLVELETVTKRLENAIDLSLDELNSAFQSLANILTSPSGVSAHEFLGSGVVLALVKFFSSVRRSFFSGDLNEISFEDSEESNRALDCFCDVFCKKLARPELSPVNSPMMAAKGTVDNGSQTPTYFHILVWKIVEALEKTERFSIFAHTDGLSSLSEGLRQLTRGLRLSLKLSGEEKHGLTDLGPNHIGIDPLASVSAIEEFLSAKCLKLPAGESAKPTNFNNGAGIVEAGENDEYNSEEEEEFSEHLGLPPMRDIQVEDVRPSMGGFLRRPRTTHKIGLSLNGKRLQYSMPIIEAIYEAAADKINTEMGGLKGIWSTVHTIEYFLLPGVLDSGAKTNPPERYTLGPSSVKDNMLRTGSGWIAPENDSISSIYSVPMSLMVEKPYQKNASFFWSLNSVLLDREERKGAEQETEELLSILRILFAFGIRDNLVTANDFVSPKLSAKVVRQVQDPVTVCAGAVPAWVHRLVSGHSFLLTYNARCAYSRTTAYGNSRALHHIQNAQLISDSDTNGPAGEEVFRVGRIPRQKVRIQRSNLFESAIKVMDMFGSSKSILDIEYFDEPGTGLGPSQEFYTLVSRALQRKGLGLWRDNGDFELDELEKIVDHPLGLFPRSIGPAEPEISPISSKRSTSASPSILRYFSFAGKFVAKALMDSHLIDIPFSSPFLKIALLNKRLCFEDLKEIDNDLWNHFSKIRCIVIAKEKKQDSLLYDGVPIDDLGFVFTCPGCDSVELKPNGANISVTSENVQEYFTLGVGTILDTGIRSQVAAFKKGFSSVASMTHLQSYSVTELETLMRGEDDWGEPSLFSEYIRCDHGFTADSPVVKWLLEIMAEFSAEQRRLFLSFITGSPRLPSGGLRGLKPPLTVVRKHVDVGSVDDCLPSVMTCVYYLKLPQYSSKDCLRDRLLIAVKEGSEFHLS